MKGIGPGGVRLAWDRDVKRERGGYTEAKRAPTWVGVPNIFAFFSKTRDSALYQAYGIPVLYPTARTGYTCARSDVPLRKSSSGLSHVEPGALRGVTDLYHSSGMTNCKSSNQLEKLSIGQLG